MYRGMVGLSGACAANLSGKGAETFIRPCTRKIDFQGLHAHNFLKIAFWAPAKTPLTKTLKCAIIPDYLG